MGALRRLLWRPNLDAIALKWLRLHFDYKADGKTGQDRPAAGGQGDCIQFRQGLKKLFEWNPIQGKAPTNRTQYAPQLLI